MVPQSLRILPMLGTEAVHANNVKNGPIWEVVSYEPFDENGRTICLQLAVHQPKKGKKFEPQKVSLDEFGNDYKVVLLP